MKGHNLYTIIPYKASLLKFSDAVSARAFYKNHYIDLLTGLNHPFEIEGWLKTLDFPVLTQTHDKRFIHLFYELGFMFEGMTEEIGSDELLAVDIEYTKKEITALAADTRKIDLALIDAPHFFEYEKQFQEGYRELTEGNCYQFNLTGMYRYSFSEALTSEDFITALWREPKHRGAYASATYIEALEKLFLSNSPECLFQYENGVLVTRPIKGTLKRLTDDKDEIQKLWRELTADKKSQAELFMIADLLRNDLSRIDLPRSVVTKKKAPLLVPGLIHQYSEISVELRAHVTLKNILQKIYPGGSITGAPKKRVMMILKRLEQRSRGLYCGSTVAFSKNKIDASINIRASVIDFKNLSLTYQAGGGITLLSDVLLEFEEMTYKHDSYIDILTP